MWCCGVKLLTASPPDEPKIDLNEEELRSELQQVEVGHALTKLDQDIADRRLHEALWITEVHELMSRTTGSLPGSKNGSLGSSRWPAFSRSSHSDWALLSLGVACWLSREDAAGGAPNAAISAMLLYNAGVVAVLTFAGWSLALNGIGLWPVVLAHMALAAWCVACLSRPQRSLRP